MIIAPIIRILFKLYQAYKAKQGNGAQQVTGGAQAGTAQPGFVTEPAQSAPQSYRPSVRSARLDTWRFRVALRGPSPAARAASSAAPAGAGVSLTERASVCVRTPGSQPRPSSS